MVQGPRPGEVYRESTASSPEPKDDDLLSTAMEFSGILFVVPGALAWTLQPSRCPWLHCAIMVLVPDLAWRDVQNLQRPVLSQKTMTW